MWVRLVGVEGGAQRPRGVTKLVVERDVLEQVATAILAWERGEEWGGARQ